MSKRVDGTGFCGHSLSGWPEHAEHGRWKRTSPCVYCACGARLYNGTAPATIDEQREMAQAMEAIAKRRASVTPEARDAGEKLRQDRLSRDMSLREEAERLGISPAVLSRRERGEPDA